MCFFIISLAAGLVGGLVLAPADAIQGDGFRIIYVHAPAAFLSLFIYTVMAGAAIATLVWRIKLAPWVMKESASLGATFTALALITGSLWGKPMWGTWWLWDARLTSELILFFLYASYLLLQSALADRPHHERALAILVLVGSVDLPIIHYSVVWWNTLHQGETLKLFSQSSIAPSMKQPLLCMMLAFLLYYCLVLFKRLAHQWETKT
jgi:heme exporter protein C